MQSFCTPDVAPLGNNYVLRITVIPDVDDDPYIVDPYDHYWDDSEPEVIRSEAVAEPDRGTEGADAQ